MRLAKINRKTSKGKLCRGSGIKMTSFSQRACEIRGEAVSGWQRESAEVVRRFQRSLLRPLAGARRTVGRERVGAEIELRQQKLQRLGAEQVGVETEAARQVGRRRLETGRVVDTQKVERGRK